MFYQLLSVSGVVPQIYKTLVVVLFTIRNFWFLVNLWHCVYKKHCTNLRW